MSISRRDFFKQSATALATAMTMPCIVPSSVFGGGSVLPSERIVMG